MLNCKVNSSLKKQLPLFFNFFIKYGGNYNDDNLTSYFHLMLEEIKQKEIEILSLLKNTDEAKGLRKRKNIT